MQPIFLGDVRTVLPSPAHVKDLEEEVDDKKDGRRCRKGLEHDAPAKIPIYVSSNKATNSTPCKKKPENYPTVKPVNKDHCWG